MSKGVSEKWECCAWLHREKHHQTRSPDRDVTPAGNRRMCHALRHVASAKCHLSSWSLASQPPLCSGTPYARASTASDGIINQGDQLCLPGKVRQQERMMQMEALLHGRSWGRVSSVSLWVAVQEAWKVGALQGRRWRRKGVCPCSIEWLSTEWWGLWERPNYCATGNTV